MNAVTRVARVVVVVAVVGSVVGVATASGQEPERTIVRSPAEGPPGTVIEVSGTGCLLFGHATDFVFVRLYAIAGSISQPFDTWAEFPIAPSGTWSGRLTVPDDAPAGMYTLGASCSLDDQVLTPTETGFRVLQGSTTTSTSATTTTTTSTMAPIATTTTAGPTTTSPSTLPPAQPAVAVRAEPNFTG